MQDSKGLRGIMTNVGRKEDYPNALKMFGILPVLSAFMQGRTRLWTVNYIL